MAAMLILLVAYLFVFIRSSIDICMLKIINLVNQKRRKHTAENVVFVTKMFFCYESKKKENPNNKSRNDE